MLEAVGIAFFAVYIFFTVLFSIFPITNSMSGNTGVMTGMLPYFILYPIILVLFTIAFIFMCNGLDVDKRKTAVFLYAAISFLFAMLTLHLSCFNVKIVSK